MNKPSNNIQTQIQMLKKEVIRENKFDRYKY